jgi:Zn-dependent protease/predicted transcriptional regulator
LFSRGSLTVLRVGGVPIRLHVSVLLLVPMMVFGLSEQMSLVAEAARLPPSALALPPWFFGAVGAVGLLVCITLHELAHTAVALHYGGKVESIVLMALGGVSQIARMPSTPRHELLMAIAGPATSLALGVLAAGGYFATRSMPDVAFILYILAYLNLVLGLFNLLPALPMDGGRVLRAALAGRMGKFRATRISSGVAKAMAGGLVVLGFLGGGFWIILIAAFVWMGASQERLRADLEHSLEGLQVGDLHRTVPEIASAQSLELARERMLEHRADSLVVVDDGEAVGVLRKREVLAVPPAERAAARVAAHMIRVAAMVTGEVLGETFDRVLRDGEVPVVDEGGHAVGVVTRDAVLRTLSDRNPQLRPPEA